MKIKKNKCSNNTKNNELSLLGNCENGLKCFNGKCRKYLKQGEKCSIIDNINLCDIGLNCIKDENSEFKCLDYGFSSYLENCKLDSDCTSNNQKCVYGYCQLLNYTQCFSSADCLSNQICSFETSIYKCVTLNLKGGYCYSSRVCFQGLKCVNGICTENNLNKLGQYCNSDYNCDINNGLYCSELEICENFFKPKSIDDCNYIENNNNNSQCEKYQSCSCDDKCIQTKGYPIQYSLEYDLKKCSYDNDCVYGDSINMFSKQSCVYKKCRSQLCKYKSSVIFDNVITDSSNCGYAKYQIDKYCNSSLNLKHSVVECNIELNGPNDKTI
ncbi:hypothetical protein ACTFIW_008618 [Dictyostelium discoideum]